MSLLGGSAGEGRSPSGERGLKYEHAGRTGRRGSRSPSGERGLKYQVIQMTVAHHGRSPSGERGLKFRYPVQGGAGCPVAPHPGSVD